MSKIYSKHIIKIPENTNDENLLMLKSFADIFYTAYDTLSSEQMKPVTRKVRKAHSFWCGMDSMILNFI